VSEDGRFMYESLQDAESIAAYLHSLIEGFQKRRIALRSDGGELFLHPKDLLTFAVQAKKKNDKTKLTIKISWKEMDDPGDSFSITA